MVHSKFGMEMLGDCRSLVGPYMKIANPKSITFFLLTCLLLAACSPNHPAENIPAITETVPPSATPLPAPQAVDLGILGKGSARDVAWSLDGSLLAVSSSAGAFFYDTTTWELLKSVPVGTLGYEAIDSLAFTPDGKGLIFAAGYPVIFQSYDLQSGQVNPWFENVPHDPRSAPVFSSNGKTFAFINVSEEKIENGQESHWFGLELRESATGKLLYQLQQNDPEHEKVISTFGL